MIYKICLSILSFVFTISYGGVGKVSLNEGRLVPKLLNYQGYLTDSLGSPIEDSLDMTFKIYDAAALGSELWNETLSDVPVERGVFSVLLGLNNPIPDSIFIESTNRWLELKVETQILSPRTQITSVAYAYAAVHADTAQYAMKALPELYYSEDEAMSTTSSTAWLDKVVLALSHPGDYLISATAEAGPTSGSTMGTRLTFDGSVIGGTVVLDVSFYRTVSWIKKITATASSTVKIEYCRTTGTGDVAIRFARISALRLD